MEMTVAQALVRFMAAQQVERDGVRNPFFAGCFGILGHGNVAGLGQAFQQHGPALPFIPARNEQSMVHVAAGYARQRNRLATYACTTSVGPGATNMITAAAGATINRLPVLLLPSDTFAGRGPHPVLQQLEVGHDATVSVNDCLRPISRFFDRVQRPEQLISAALEAMRVLTDPADTGAVTLALPEDVQTEALDVPSAFLAERVWTIHRQPPAPDALARAVALIAAARRPMIVAGGGVIYSEALGALRVFAEQTGIPVGETQAGRGALVSEHELSLGAIGATGTPAANRMAREADLVIGIGTRWSDFTTASKSAFQNPEVRFVNINVAALDLHKQAGLAVSGDARVTLEQMSAALAQHAYRAAAEWTALARELSAGYRARVAELVAPSGQHPLRQAEIIGAVNDAAGETGVVVGAAGSLPGDLHALWQARDPQGKGYHVEYGYSCMGYEIPGGMGVKLAAPGREVYVTLGDGSWLMSPGELATAVSERIAVIVVLIDNQGYRSIGALSRSVGSGGFATHYRRPLDGDPLLDPEDSSRLEEESERLPTDLAKVAEGLGAAVIRVRSIEELRDALTRSRGSAGPVVIHVESGRYDPLPDSEGWWEVPVAATSESPPVRSARKTYETNRRRQRQYIQAT